jgi:hypothetical protein
MKPRYFKMDDVLYLLRFLHRYLSDTSRYVSAEYMKINFFVKNNYPILFRYVLDTRDRWWKTDMCRLPDVSIIFGIYVIE